MYVCVHAYSFQACVSGCVWQYIHVYKYIQVIYICLHIDYVQYNICVIQHLYQIHSYTAHFPKILQHSKIGPKRKLSMCAPAWICHLADWKPVPSITWSIQNEPIKTIICRNGAICRKSPKKIPNESTSKASWFTQFSFPQRVLGVRVLCLDFLDQQNGLGDG
jgi:hypothetical protein